jgi:hypothetical protein
MLPGSNTGIWVNTMSPNEALARNWNHDGRRTERLGVQMKAALRSAGAIKFDVDVRDMSVAGFRFDTVYTLKVGARVWLTVPGLQALESKVMWCEGFHYGCAFVAPLHTAVFDRIVSQFRKRHVAR